ncbi:hypothetical protein D3C84_637260 [compost metagenome]
MTTRTFRGVSGSLSSAVGHFGGRFSYGQDVRGAKPRRGCRDFLPDHQRFRDDLAHRSKLQGAGKNRPVLHGQGLEALPPVPVLLLRLLRGDLFPTARHAASGRSDAQEHRREPSYRAPWFLHVRGRRGGDPAAGLVAGA